MVKEEGLKNLVKDQIRSQLSKVGLLRSVLRAVMRKEGLRLDLVPQESHPLRVAPADHLSASHLLANLHSVVRPVDSPAAFRVGGQLVVN